MLLDIIFSFFFLSFPFDTSAVTIEERLSHSSFNSRPLVPVLETIEFAHNVHSTSHSGRKHVAIPFQEGHGDKESLAHSARATTERLTSKKDSRGGVNFLLLTPASSSATPQSLPLPVDLLEEGSRDGAAPDEPKANKQRQRVDAPQKNIPLDRQQTRQKPTRASVIGSHHNKEQVKVQHQKSHVTPTPAFIGQRLKPEEHPDQRGNQRRTREQPQQQQQQQRRKREEKGPVSAGQTASERGGILSKLRNVFTPTQSHQDAPASQSTGLFSTLRNKFTITQSQEQNAASLKKKELSMFKNCLPGSNDEECVCEAGYYFNGADCTSVVLTNVCNPGTAYQTRPNTYECNCPEGYIGRSITVETLLTSSSTTSSTVSKRQQPSSSQKKSLLVARCVANPCSGHRNCLPGRCIPVTEGESPKYYCDCPTDYDNVVSPTTNMEICRERSQLLCGNIEEESCGPPELVEGCMLTRDTVQCSCRSPAYLNPYSEKCTDESICKYMPCGRNRSVAACVVGKIPGTWKCRCKEGFKVTRDKQGRERCTQINHCAKDPCGPADKVEKCISNLVGYTCKCQPGYTLRRGPTSSVCE